ncbi:MAG: hypothetical protein EBQ71_13150 [Betaproteobacteria bacterium]|nr:hypothetical protein [Betaproteobacteria bacterium]
MAGLRRHLWHGRWAATACCIGANPKRCRLPKQAGENRGGLSGWGGTDVFARVLAQGLSAQLGQQFVIDNKPGAGGVIASQSMLQLPADGYSLLVGSTSTQALPPCSTTSGLTGPKTSLPLRTLPA